MRRKKKVSGALALFFAGVMAFSPAGNMILASEPETSAVSEQAPEHETKSAPETQAVTEAPATEAPPTEAPATEAPATEAPPTEAPATEAPATEAPATEAPVTDAPATETPSTEAPATEAPDTEAPDTDAPATEKATEEQPTETETVSYTVKFDVHAADHGKIVAYGETVDVAAYNKEVLEKESFTFCVIPEEGYEVDRVRVDETDVPKTELPQEYKLAAVEKDAVITVTYKETEKEKTEVENVVTFEADEGVSIFAWGETKVTSAAMAKDGKIVFTILAEEGYTITEVLVDGTIPARQTENPNEYIIEGILTDNTIVTIKTALAEGAEETESEAESEAEETETESEAVFEEAEGEAQVNGGDQQQEIAVRAEADGLSEILFMLPHGAQVSILGIEGDWVMIDYQGQVGYVYKANLVSVETEDSEEDTTQPKVTIFSSRKAVMEQGETVTLTSRLEYAEGCEIHYQWQCDKGAGFENVDGAVGDTYTFEADAQTLSYDWRLAVYYR